MIEISDDALIIDGRDAVLSMQEPLEDITSWQATAIGTITADDIRRRACISPMMLQPRLAAACRRSQQVAETATLQAYWLPTHEFGASFRHGAAHNRGRILLMMARQRAPA